MGLICMDSNGDPVDQCNSQVGVDSSAVNSCLADDTDLINQYLKIDEPIRATPTVTVNGKNVDASYNAIHKALCAADPSFDACSNELLPEDWKAAQLTPAHGAVEV